LEITNPGGLVSVISDKEFGTKSHSRNPLIFGLFERIDMVEQIGSGIGRIKDAIKQSKLPAPVFKTSGMFSVVFIRPDIKKWKSKEKTREKTREKIIRLIKENNTITIIELAKETGISEKGVEYHLNILKKDNIIKRHGPDKGGKWLIVKNESY